MRRRAPARAPSCRSLCWTAHGSGGRKILMLEPRRIAARAVAQRMAQLLGEPVGKTVGYRTRFDTRVGRDTRIEVVTEGILTRMLQADAELRRRRLRDLR